jgi:hypothetical protein
MAFSGNLGPGERRRRLVNGTALGLVTVALAVALAFMNINPGWRLVLLAPAFVAALGFSQAQANT